jgi:ribulokinase
VECLIGVDVGTQGTKAILIDREGNILSSGYQCYGLLTPKPAWAEQWPDVWIEAVYAVIKTVLAKAPVSPHAVKAIAVSSLYGGSGIPVDHQIKPLDPCLIWMDRRASKEVAWVRQNVDLERLFQITGNSVDSYYGFTKILWIKNNKPDVWEKIKYLLPPNAYIIYQLTGDIAVDYSSAGNIGGIFDINAKTWSQEMLDQLGIPMDYLPEKLVASSDPVGTITSSAAELTGLAVGTPVMAGGVDAAVATLSAGAFRDGNHVAMVGTSMCWGFITEKTDVSSRLISMPHVLDPLRKVYTFGGAITAGAVIRWFKDVLGEKEMLAEKILDMNAYQILEFGTKDIPAGSAGLVVLPYFMGERSPVWDSHAKGTIVGLSLYHSKAHLFRAFMEGVAFALRHNMEVISGADLKLDQEVTLVGGAGKSSMWPQIFADVTGRPVRIIKNDVEAPLGDALLAGLGAGIIHTPEVLSEWLTFDKTIEPNTMYTPIYDALFAEYKTIYIQLKDTMARLTRIQQDETTD